MRPVYGWEASAQRGLNEFGKKSRGCTYIYWGGEWGPEGWGHGPPQARAAQGFAWDGCERSMLTPQ